MTDLVTSEAGPQDRDIERQLEEHRAELTGYCYRMLGSAFEAEDAVQETLVRAWRNVDRFEGRAALRTWLYRIATNACLDLLRSRKRRARPVDLGPAGTPESLLGPALPDSHWIEPIPDSAVLPAGGDPAELAVARESVRLAFVAALQHLPPRQRAVLILRDVLRWKASEVAALLETSVTSVNSTLQRAHATMSTKNISASDSYGPMDDTQRHLLERYIDAFERYDLDSLTALLHEDATLSMPPYALWLRGREAVRGWFTGTGSGCEGSRLLPTMANGTMAFGQYRTDGAGGHVPWALHVLELAGDQVVADIAFLDTARLFPLFGLPPRP